MPKGKLTFMFHSKSGVSDFDTSASAAWLKCVLKQRSGKSHTYIKNNKLYFFKIRLCFDAGFFTPRGHNRTALGELWTTQNYSLDVKNTRLQRNPDKLLEVGVCCCESLDTGLPARANIAASILTESQKTPFIKSYFWYCIESNQSVQCEKVALDFKHTENQRLTLAFQNF